MREWDASDHFPRELLEYGSDVFFRSGLDMRFQYVSPNIERVLGWPPAELLGRPIDEFVIQDDRASAPDGWFDEQGMMSLRGQARRKDGTAMWFENRMLGVFNDAGALTGFTGVFRDIDRQVVAEGQLMESEQLFRMVAEHASEVVVRGDNDGVLQWASPSIEEALGRRPAELVGSRVIDIVEPADRDVVRAAQAEVGRGQPAHFEARFLHADGRPIWHAVNVAPLIDAHGVVLGRVASWRSIDLERRQRDALRQSEERFRLLAENASDVVVQTDRDLVVQWVSPSVTEMLGWPVFQLMGRSVAFLLHDDDRAELEASNREILAGRAVQFEARYRTIDGRWTWMSVVAHPVVEADGEVVGRISSWRDIDEEHSQRVALGESEERYRLLAENASDIVVQLDADGLIRWLSPSTEQILGHRIPDLIGRPVLEIVHPDDVPIVVAAQIGAARGEGARFEARYLRGDGTFIWMSVVGTSIRDEQGNVIGRVASARNVNNERAARDALAESEERFRFLVENVQDVVIRTHDGTLVFVSPSVERVLGWRADELLEIEPAHLIHPDDAALAAHFRVEGDERPVSNVRLRLRHRDGRYRWIEVTARPVDLGDGHRNLVAALRDVDERVMAEEALAAATEEAQAANLAKTTFLSRMSHELRTPLNAVLGFAQLLAMDPLSDDQRSGVEQILNGGRHLLELINEVLDIARIESGRMTLSPEAVSAADAVSECLDLVRPLALQHDVILEHFDPEGCDDQLFVDRQRTIQILINLVSNAIKYNRVGGRVRVKCEHPGDRPDMLIIAVADDGIGIAADNLPKLFAPFERLGAASTGVEGTGIGLALSRGLAEMMHGDVTVESTEGVGSVFRLVLPRAEAAVGADIPSAAGQQVDTSTVHRTVMYLEDNPANAMLMRSILSRRGAVDLTIATRGAEALDQLFTSPPDLLLLDLHLPDIGGDEVLRRLRTDPRTSTLPVVVLTADAAPQVRQQLVTLGADAFLAKPVDINEVLSWVDDPMQGRRSR